MKKLQIEIVLMCVVLIVTAMPVSAETGRSPDPNSVDRGLSLYTKNCASCHQQNGVGEMIPWSIRNPEFVPAMPLNESSHAWHHGDEQLIQTIQNGNMRMPPFEKLLSASELQDVVAYIKSLWSDRILACQGPRHMSCM